MKETTIDLIEPTPIPKSSYCKVISKVIELFLRFSIYFFGLILYLSFDIFVSCIGLAIYFIVLGIIKSKLRLISIPYRQLEFDYSDREISQWYVMKYLC